MQRRNFKGRKLENVSAEGDDWESDSTTGETKKITRIFWKRGYCRL